VRYTELAPDRFKSFGELTMAKLWKTDLFATAEDDIRQFGAALFGLFRAAPRAMAERVGTTTRRDFAHRIDLWDSSGEDIVEHLAGIEDFELAMATYRAACERWPGANITLRAGARVIEDTRRVRTAAAKYPLA
jgi:hypothetical protein